MPYLLRHFSKLVKKFIMPKFSQFQDTDRRSKQNDRYERIVSSWELFFFQTQFYSSPSPCPLVVLASLGVGLVDVEWFECSAAEKRLVMSLEEGRVARRRAWVVVVE